MATQTEIANHLFMNRRTAAELVARGILQTGMGLDAAREAYIRHIREQAAGRMAEAMADENATALDIERTRLTKAQADKTELEVERLKRTLIPAEDVDRVWNDHIAAARSKFLAIPSKLAAQLLAADEQIEIEDLLRATIYEALAEMATQGDDEYDSESEAQGVPDLEPAANVDVKPVGKPKAKAVSGGQRRTRAVQQRPSPVPDGNNGRRKRPKDS